MDINVKQGAATKILIPVTDANGDPVDLTTLDGTCFTYGKKKSYPGDVTKTAGDPGCEIVTDKTDHPDAKNNALRVTLTEEETRIPAGGIYVFAAWAMGPDGLTLLVQGGMTVEGTVWCK